MGKGSDPTGLEFLACALGSGNAALWEAVADSQEKFFYQFGESESCSVVSDSLWPHGRILQARILKWIAFPCSRRSSQPRNWTQVSCIAGGFFTSWPMRRAMREEKWTQDQVWGFLTRRGGWLEKVEPAKGTENEVVWWAELLAVVPKVPCPGPQILWLHSCDYMAQLVLKHGAIRMCLT